MCFVFFWEQTATCASYSLNWLVFITEMKIVYSAVRTGSLNEAVCASSLTLILLTWRKWWAPNNASKQQMGFNSAFKGLIYLKRDGYTGSQKSYAVWTRPILGRITSSWGTRLNKMAVAAVLFRRIPSKIVHNHKRSEPEQALQHSACRNKDNTQLSVMCRHKYFQNLHPKTVPSLHTNATQQTT